MATTAVFFSAGTVRADMTVGIVGSGPAAAAAEAALSDVGVDAVRTETDTLGEHELGIVTGQAGDPVFSQASERAREVDGRWLAVELGGVGGIPVADAAVACFGPDSGCYECLSGRVNANLDNQSDPEGSPPTYTSRFAGAVAGREAARVLVDDAEIAGRVITLPYEQRRFLPLPNCICDDGRDRALARDYRDCDVEESLARAEQALDETLGLVQEIGEAESFPVPYYLAQNCDTAGFSDTSAAREAAGVAAEWDAAFMKALGEGLERYCAGVYRDEEFRIGRADEVAAALPPEEFVCAVEPSPGERLRWVDGRDLTTDEPVRLPATFVHYPPPKQRFRSPVTTGLGLGNSTVEALLAGLYEVIERDAMMLSWYSSYEPLALDLDDPVIETLVGRARSENLSVTPLLLTQDVDVPVVAAAVHREEYPRLAVGTGAHLDVERAARSALAEALQNWTELRGMGPEEAGDALGAIGHYAADPGPAADFIDADATVPADSVGPGSVPAGGDHLDAVLGRLADADLGAYAARLTTRDVEAVGFEAVRALVPAAQPLCFGDPFFGERARAVPG
jgi:ribosomal protein S12 methylthiotransferase accessory factor